MARMSFSGAADYSQYFLQLYDKYAARLESAALEAVRNAEQEQAALDEDAANRWQAGEMSDAEWVAYVKARLAATRDDEEQQTYWKDVLRDSQDSIAQKRIENGVREIQNKIDEGDATYDDLRKFLIRERARSKEGSPIHEQLTESIDQVGDLIKDNAANGEIARAGYLFRSGQISGSAAAKMVRAAAERYRVSDPAKYWNLLSQAYDLTTAGASGGGSGGGGGASLSNAIDLLEYEADAIDLLNEQFKNGASIGTLPDGSEIVLGDEGGNPAEVWSQIDERMVEVLQAQYEAKAENGDRDAVEALQRLENYIATTVQPRNTIPSERQFGVLTNSLKESIQLATVDPEAGARAISESLGAMERWSAYLNTEQVAEFVGDGPSDEQAAANPELKAANRRNVVREEGELDQTTGEFATGAQAFIAAARQAFEGGAALTPAQAEALIGQAGGLLDRGDITQLLGGINEASVRATGLQDGSWTKVQMPNGEIAVVQMVPTTVPGPDGKPVTEIMPDWNSLGVDVGEDSSQGTAMVLRMVGGRPQMMWAVGDYAAINQTAENPEGERALVVSDAAGRATVRHEDGSWTTASGRSVPLPILGMNATRAQRWVNANPETAAAALQMAGVDPTTVDMANLYVSEERIENEDRSRALHRTGARERFAAGGQPNVQDQVQEQADRLGIQFQVTGRNKPAFGSRPTASMTDFFTRSKNPTAPNLQPVKAAGAVSVQAPRLSFDPEALRQQLANIAKPRMVGRGVQVGGSPNLSLPTIN